MKDHPDVLNAKYHFVVRRVGRHLKIKKCVQKWSKIEHKMQNVPYLSSARCHDNACRMNEVLVLVFKRRDIWLF